MTLDINIVDMMLGTDGAAGVDEAFLDSLGVLEGWGVLDVLDRDAFVGAAPARPAPYVPAPAFFPPPPAAAWPVLAAPRGRAAALREKLEWAAARPMSPAAATSVLLEPLVWVFEVVARADPDPWGPGGGAAACRVLRVLERSELKFI